MSELIVVNDVSSLWKR